MAAAPSTPRARSCAARTACPSAWAIASRAAGETSPSTRPTPIASSISRRSRPCSMRLAAARPSVSICARSSLLRPRRPLLLLRRLLPLLLLLVHLPLKRLAEPRANLQPARRAQPHLIHLVRARQNVRRLTLRHPYADLLGLLRIVRQCPEARPQVALELARRA